ncbi:MAG: hypothetical protein SV062_14745 [Thermodesulfobacteriota bacterium]|nr:hypothetical protein [Thermodesulfobacteriota bacterium]
MADIQGNGEKAKTVPIVVREKVERKEKRILAVRVVDIFGNDAGVTIELKL